MEVNKSMGLHPTQRKLDDPGASRYVPRMRMYQALVGALLVFVAHAAFAQGGAALTATGLIGAVYTPPVPAADFTLIDQHGTPFHMADMKGKVVVFSFLYTHCEDVCPFLALKLRAAQRLLGNDAARVGFVAITTDPQRDTPEVIAKYSRAIGLFDIWHFVDRAVAAGPRRMERIPRQRHGKR